MSPDAIGTFGLRVACVAGAVCVLAAACLVRRIRAALDGRRHGRMRERERRARDLHETLLQGVHGLVLSFQAVAEGLPPRSATREAFERVLVRADQVLLEGRDRLAELRLPSLALGLLAQGLAGVGRDLSQYRAARFRLTVDGTPRPLRPRVHEEAELIAREALSNAFQHARATRIELTIVHGSGTFTLCVRDDGAGLPRAMLAGGSTSRHGGIAGMRGGARRVDGRLRMWSRAGAGTETVLEIPAGKAYADGA